LVEHALGLPAQVAFNPQGRELVRNHSYRPAGGVALQSRAPIRMRAVSLNLRRGAGFIAIAKGAEAPFYLYDLSRKIRRSLGAVGGNDHPSPNDGVFSKFGQREILSR